MRITRNTAVLVLSLSLLYGCGGSPAPTDLAEFNKIAENELSILAKKGYSQPLTPAQSLEILTEGFEKTGYSYSATLKKFATDGFSTTNQLENGLVFSLLGPAVLVAQQEKSQEESLEVLSKVYSEEDLKSVIEIIRIFDSQSNNHPFFFSKNAQEAEYRERIRKRDEDIKKMDAEADASDPYKKYAQEQ